MRKHQRGDITVVNTAVSYWWVAADKLDPDKGLSLRERINRASLHYVHYTLEGYLVEIIDPNYYIVYCLALDLYSFMSMAAFNLVIPNAL